jgi:DNA-binding response OmpR family regulator
VVATIDDYDQALQRLGRDEVHLIIADVRLHGRDLGIELARKAREKGVPTLLATGHEPPPPSAHAIGCLRKPYTERLLKQALATVDRHLQGESVKPIKGLDLYVIDAE